jgi:negative regulator of flagellin synthesis FlgM
MNIHKIGHINKIFPKEGTPQTKKTDIQRANDSVEISNQAIRKFEEEKLINIVKQAPDIREDKVADIKARIKSGEYWENISLQKVAEELLKADTI